MYLGNYDRCNPPARRDHFYNGLSGVDINAISAGATAGSTFGPIGTVIGAVLGAAKGLVSKPLSMAEQTWDGYKKVQGQAPGNAYEEKAFAEIIKGAVDANRATFKIHREDVMAGLAKAIANAYLTGFPLSSSMSQLWDKVVWPWIQSANSGINAAEFQKNGALKPLFFDIIDRYLNNMPITRGDMPSFSGQNYPTHAPLIMDALQPLLRSVASPSPVPPNTQPAPIVSAPYIQGPTVPPPIISAAPQGPQTTVMAPAPNALQAPQPTVNNQMVPAAPQFQALGMGIPPVAIASAIGLALLFFAKKK